MDSVKCHARFARSHESNCFSHFFSLLLNKFTVKHDVNVMFGTKKSIAVLFPQASTRSVRYGPVNQHEIAGTHRSSGPPQRDGGAGWRGLSVLVVCHLGQ